jgi:hypothetical protein
MSLRLRQKWLCHSRALGPLLLFSCGTPSPLASNAPGPAAPERAEPPVSPPAPPVSGARNAAVRPKTCLGDEASEGSNIAISVEALADAYGPGSYWLASDELMRASRPRIAEAMKHCRDSNRSFDELMKYGCQFGGHTEEGEKVLGVICLDRPPCWWRESIVHVNDGGDSVVRAAIRPEDGAVFRINIGGPSQCGSDEDGWLRFDASAGER